MRPFIGSKVDFNDGKIHSFSSAFSIVFSCDANANASITLVQQKKAKPKTMINESSVWLTFKKPQSSKDFWAKTVFVLKGKEIKIHFC